MAPGAHETGKRRGGIALTILLGLAAFGCSGDRSLTGPAWEDRTHDAPLSIADHEGTGGGGNGSGATILPAQPATAYPSKTDTISSVAGGRIDLGPYSVTFSPGALESDTEIKVVDVAKERGHVCVELFPEGIKFDKPVTLEVRIPPGVDTRGFTMWWWGPGSDGAMRWIDVGGKVSTDGRTLSVTLEHFSTYAPGKAGWWKPQNPVGLPRAEQEGHR